MIHLCTKFHVPSSNYSLVAAAKPKVKTHFRTAAMLLFDIQQKYYLNEICIFCRGILTCYT
jgi:hypothetical protein